MSIPSNAVRLRCGRSSSSLRMEDLAQGRRGLRAMFIWRKSKLDCKPEAGFIRGSLGLKNRFRTKTTSSLCRNHSWEETAKGQKKNTLWWSKTYAIRFLTVIDPSYNIETISIENLLPCEIELNARWNSKGVIVWQYHVYL